MKKFIFLLLLLSTILPITSSAESELCYSLKEQIRLYFRSGGLGSRGIRIEGNKLIYLIPSENAVRDQEVIERTLPTEKQLREHGITNKSKYALRLASGLCVIMRAEYTNNGVTHSRYDDGMGGVYYCDTNGPNFQIINTKMEQKGLNSLKLDFIGPWTNHFISARLGLRNPFPDFPQPMDLKAPPEELKQALQRPMQIQELQQKAEQLKKDIDFQKSVVPQLRIAKNNLQRGTRQAKLSYDVEEQSNKIVFETEELERSLAYNNARLKQIQEELVVAETKPDKERHEQAMVSKIENAFSEIKESIAECPQYERQIRETAESYKKTLFQNSDTLTLKNSIQKIDLTKHANPSKEQSGTR